MLIVIVVLYIRVLNPLRAANLDGTGMIFITNPLAWDCSF